MLEPAELRFNQGAVALEEVMIGFQFSKDFALTALHLGRFWALISDQYPEAHEPKAALRLSVNEHADVYTQLRSKDRKWVLQLKRSSISLSWVAEGSPDYPGFPEVQDRFGGLFQSFCRFCTDIKLTCPEICGTHVSYVNKVQYPKSVEAPLTTVFRNLTWDSKQKMAPPPSLNLQADFPFPDDTGLLSVRIQSPVFRKGPKGLEPSILFQLVGTAEIAPRTDVQEIFSWFSVARGVINLAFFDLLEDNIRDSLQDQGDRAGR